MDGTHPTLPDTPFTLADDFRRDDEASVKDVRLAHVGSPVLRILDPRLALTVFAAKSQRRRYRSTLALTERSGPNIRTLFMRN
jgi:hypothetical protein